MKPQNGQPAAQHMDSMYKYQRYIYDLTRKYYLLGRDHLIDELRPPSASTVLEVGCGTGRNLISIAKRYPETRCVGFDVSEQMLQTARKSILKAGLHARVSVAQGDATDFSLQSLFGVAVAERVVVSYALSMIPPWEETVKQALAAVAPGGELHVVDFGLQEQWPEAPRSMLRAWLNKFSTHPREDLLPYLDQCAKEAGSTLRSEQLYRGYSVYAVIRKPHAPN